MSKVEIVNRAGALNFAVGRKTTPTRRRRRRRKQDKVEKGASCLTARRFLIGFLHAKSARVSPLGHVSSEKLNQISILLLVSGHVTFRRMSFTFAAEF